MDGDIVLVIVVATALVFDFTNGFHDTANVVATSISTHALLAAGRRRHGGDAQLRRRLHLDPGRGDVAKDVVDAGAITPTVIFAGLVGAIAWNLITWYFGLPVEFLARADRRRRRLP